jgi:hypothetical protein
MAATQLDRSPPTTAAAAVRDRLGGGEGNEILTSVVAIVLTALLVAEGVTIVHMRGLVGAHMFVGMVLIPPVALKLGSTGYRFVRYYARARAYRAKGPPLLPLRITAPVLVASTVVLLTSGVLLMAEGHVSRALLQIHQTSFVVWLVVFVPHLLWYTPRVVRSLLADWGEARRIAVPGSGLRAMLVAASVGGGAALAIALLPTIDMWRH